MVESRRGRLSWLTPAAQGLNYFEASCRLDEGKNTQPAGSQGQKDSQGIWLLIQVPMLPSAPGPLSLAQCRPAD